MRYIKSLSFFKYAKRLKQPMLRIDVGEKRSGVFVAIPSSGVIFPARSPIDVSIYSFEHNLKDMNFDIFNFSTSLNELAGYYDPVGFHFGFLVQLAASRRFEYGEG